MKWFVVCYDISSNSRRTKLMKRLRSKGFHAQLSFFELEAPSPSEAFPREQFEETDRIAVVRVSRREKIKRIGSLIEGMEWVI